MQINLVYYIFLFKNCKYERLSIDKFVNNVIEEVLAELAGLTYTVL